MSLASMMFMLFAVHAVWRGLGSARLLLLPARREELRERAAEANEVRVLPPVTTLKPWLLYHPCIAILHTTAFPRSDEGHAPRRYTHTSPTFPTFPTLCFNAILMCTGDRCKGDTRE